MQDKNKRLEFLKNSIGDWNLESFPPFFLKWVIDESDEKDGISIICNLFVNNHPCQSFRLNQTQKECSFHPKLTDNSATGKLKFIDANGKPCLGIDITYGSQGNTKTIENYIVPGSDELNEPDDTRETDTSEKPDVSGKPDTPKEVFMESGEHQDLFPFMYMRTCSEISQDALKSRFIKYDTTKVPPQVLETSLYSELIKIKKASEPDTRIKMEQEAIAFINPGTVNSEQQFSGQFIKGIYDLKGSIKHFAQINSWVRQQTDLSLSELKCEIERILKIEWQDIENYIQSQDYLTEKDRVWQNFFALTIIPGYRPHLLDEITKTLVMGSLMEKIVAPHGVDANEANALNNP